MLILPMSMAKGGEALLLIFFGRTDILLSAKSSTILFPLISPSSFAGLFKFNWDGPIYTGTSLLGYSFSSHNQVPELVC